MDKPTAYVNSRTGFAIDDGGALRTINQWVNNQTRLDQDNMNALGNQVVANQKNIGAWDSSTFIDSEFNSKGQSSDKSDGSIFDLLQNYHASFIMPRADSTRGIAFHSDAENPTLIQYDIKSNATGNKNPRTGLTFLGEKMYWLKPNETAASDNYVLVRQEELNTASNQLLGSSSDSVDEITFNGVKNYATAESEKITEAYEAADKVLEEKIVGLDTALKNLADKDVVAEDPDFKYTNNTNIGTVEVGTELTPKYEIQFTSGKYKYEPTSTGVEATSYKVTFNNETLETSSGTFTNNVHVTDDTSLVLSATCKYSDGDVPKNNLGLDYPEGKIASKTVTRQKTLKGYRQAFAGGLASKSELNSGIIRKLKNPKEEGYTTKEFTFDIASDTTRVVVAFPSSWGILKTALDVNDSSKNIVTSFGSYGTVQVSGVTPDQDELEYNVYVMDFASAYGGSGNTYKIKIG